MIKYSKLKREKITKKYTKICRQKFCHELLNRYKSPEERLKVGQKVKCMVKYIDEKTGKINLSYKSCLGTWEENVSNFKEGMTVKGIVRDTEKNKNGVFIELTPNLVGMTEYTEDLKYGQTIDVCIKKIIPDKKKVKLTIV